MTDKEIDVVAEALASITIYDRRGQPEREYMQKTCLRVAEQVAKHAPPPPPIWSYVPTRKADTSLTPVPLASYVKQFQDLISCMRVPPSSASPSFVFLDTEGRVYVNEIAAVSFDGNIEMVAKISSDPFFLRKDPTDTIPVSTFWEELSSKLPGSKDSTCYVCVHNAFSHDMPLLMSVSAIPERFVFVDTLLFFWCVFGGWSALRQRVPSCTLESLSKTVLGKTYTEKQGAHTALEDARVLRRVTLTVLRLMSSSTAEKGNWTMHQVPDTGDVVPSGLLCMIAWIKFCSLRVPVAVINRGDVSARSFRKLELSEDASVYVSKRAVSAPKQAVMHASVQCKKIPLRHREITLGAARKENCRKCEACFAAHS